MIYLFVVLYMGFKEYGLHTEYSSNTAMEYCIRVLRSHVKIR